MFFLTKVPEIFSLLTHPTENILFFNPVKDMTISVLTFYTRWKTGKQKKYQKTVYAVMSPGHRTVKRSIFPNVKNLISTALPGLT